MPNKRNIPYSIRVHSREGDISDLTIKIVTMPVSEIMASIESPRIFLDT